MDAHKQRCNKDVGRYPEEIPSMNPTSQDLCDPIDAVGLGTISNDEQNNEEKASSNKAYC